MRLVGMAVGGDGGGRGWRWAGMAVGGEIFALRRPRPYSRAFAGRGLRAMPLTIIYAHAGINGNGGG